MSFENLRSIRRALAVATLALVLGASASRATPYLVADADSGQTLVENEATRPWYPASVTKLMTTYVALSAVRDGRLTMDTPLVMSVRASRAAPSKMGFRPGTEVTLDNALKMLMVKSPNDVAIMVAEGISGSVENFADEMNATASRLGLKESHFVNPNGLQDPRHVSSARDMALVARALLHDFPEHADLFDIGAIQLGPQIIRNHNGLLGRYPGANGMKTGFTCSSGFNVVASATQGGRRLIVVVFGAPSARQRTNEAGRLFDRGFAQWGGGTPLEALQASAYSEAPDMHGEICSRRNRAAVAALDEDFVAPAAGPPAGGRGGGAAGVAATASISAPIADGRVHFDPITVFVGRKEGWVGPALAARVTGTISSEVNAYAAEKSPEAAPGDLAAPVALQGAVKPQTAATTESRKGSRVAKATKAKKHLGKDLNSTAKSAQ